MVVAFVEGLTTEMPEKVAYVTHVPSGSQAILDREGQVIRRHDGRADGPDRLDALLADSAAMARIMGASPTGRARGPNPIPSPGFLWCSSTGPGTRNGGAFPPM